MPSPILQREIKGGGEENLRSSVAAKGDSYLGRGQVILLQWDEDASLALSLKKTRPPEFFAYREGHCAKESEQET